MLICFTQSSTILFYFVLLFISEFLYYVFFPTIVIFLNHSSPLELQYNETLSVLGVTGKAYTGNDFFIDNGTDYPEQKCFVPEGEYLPKGVRDVSLCKQVLF